MREKIGKVREKERGRGRERMGERGREGKRGKEGEGERKEKRVKMYCFDLLKLEQICCSQYLR